MFSKLIKLLGWLAFVVALSAGTYLFWIGGRDSYMCRSTRVVSEYAPVLPIPIGFCGVVDHSDPRNLPPPEKPAAIEETVYFSRESAYGEHPYKEQITIGPGCTFSPIGQRYKSNTHLTFVNEDVLPHAIQADRGPDTPVAFADFLSPPIQPGAKYKLFVNQVGTFRFRCQDKPESKGHFEVYEW
jgi:hypothetical protein